MAARGSFTCPACGAEFEVQERIAKQGSTASDAAHRQTTQDSPAEVAGEPVSFQCPACGADYEAQEALAEEAAR